MAESRVHRHTLDNGLQLVWKEDHRQPLVAIEARILGGLRGEGAYLGTGITHFLEHLLFKGTTSRPPGTIDHEVRHYGGTINAFTSLDTTGVSLYVESRYLREALGMLADILQHAVFPPEEFTKERAVVVSEIHMNQDDPERRLHRLFWAHHLLVHPYRHPILGYQSLLEQLTVEDMRKFYAAQYVPNNVVVTCVGDLDASTFSQLAEETFGAWKRAHPYQITVAEEPSPTGLRQAADELPVQAAYALLGFQSTRLADPDMYALDVLASIVGQGRSSRMYEDIVRKRRLAEQIGASNYTPFDRGAFSIFVRADPARLDDAIEAALEALETVKQQGISDQELRKAVRQVVADYVFHRQTIEAEAGDLANSVAMTGDPTFSLRYVEEIKRVTKDQVVQAAKRYCDRSRMTQAIIRPPTAKPVESAPAAMKPTIQKTVLPNGMTVLLGVDRHLPMTVAVLASRGGVRVETDQQQGLSNLVAQLLVKGTSHKTATDIATQIESLGGNLEPFSGRDGLGLSLQVLAEDLPVGLELLHELTTDSTFPDDELALQRELILKELEAREDDIFDVAGRLLRRTLFSAHPYRFDPLGTRESVERLRRADCQAFAKAHLVPRNLVFAVVGDFNEQAIRQEIARRFGALPDRAPTWPQTLPADAVDGIRRATQTLPKEQSVIFEGFRGTRMVADDRYDLDVLTAVLSGMSGRLFQAVREQQGLSYTLGAFHVPGWDQGYIAIYAATRPQEQQAVIKTLQEQIEILIAQGVTPEELDQAKRYLIGNHRLDLQHLGGWARRAALDELYGVGYDAWQQYEARINAVTAARVKQAAAAYLQVAHRAEVIVGPDVPPREPEPAAAVESHAR